MKKQIGLALAALAIGGIGLTMSAPASAQDRGHQDNTYRGSDNNHDNRGNDRNQRFHNGDRGRHPARYEYHRNGCATYWSWNDRRGEYVRKDRCRR